MPSWRCVCLKGRAHRPGRPAAKELKLLPPFISFDSWKPAIVEDVTRIMAELRGDTFLRSSPLLSRLAKDNPRFYVDQKAQSEDL